MPRQVVEADLQAADVIVAVDAEAHRPMVQDRFPAWKKRIRFWAVQDRGEEEGRHPIALLEQQVRDLAAELSRWSSADPVWKASPFGRRERPWPMGFARRAGRWLVTTADLTHPTVGLV